MIKNKSTNLISEINKYFKENETTNAMNAIARISSNC